MKNKLLIFILTIIIYFIFLYFQPKRCNLSMPILFNIYPNSEEEIKLVEEAVRNRTPEDVEFFKKTKYTLYETFLEVEPTINKKEFYNFVWKNLYIIVVLKLFFNRIRPYQLNKNLDIIENNIASYNSAFPSGHAFIAYSIANKYSKIYPNKKEEFYLLADKIGYVRVKSGYHYPSDIQYSYYLVHYYQYLFDFLYRL